MSRLERYDQEKLNEKEIVEAPSHDKAPNLTNCKESKSLSVKESKQSRSKPAKRKQSKYKTRKKTILTIVISLLAINVVFISSILLTRDLALKGNAEMSINVGEEFKDPGTNLHSKVSGKVDVNVPGDYTLTYTKGEKEGDTSICIPFPKTLIDFYSSNKIQHNSSHKIIF